jgi:uncharacterized RDD family membrane protein YckC
VSDRLEAVRSNASLQNLWIRRVIAFIVDSIIVGIIFAIVSIIFTVLLLPVSLMTANLLTGLSAGVSTLLSPIIVYGYYTFFEGSFNATIGKMFLGLRVIPIRGGTMNYKKAFVRNLTKPWNWVIAVLFLLDLLLGFATEGDPRERFMDTLAGTVVITPAQ